MKKRLLAIVSIQSIKVELARWAERQRRISKVGFLDASERERRSLITGMINQLRARR